MTPHAFDTRVWRALVSCKFRLHCRMAGLAAEADGFHVIHCAVSELPGDYDVGECSDPDESHQAPQFRIMESQRRKGLGEFPRGSLAVAAPQNACGNQD